MLVGRRVACPDCGGAIEIVAESPRTLAARKLEGTPERPGRRTVRKPVAAPGSDAPAETRSAYQPPARRPGWLTTLATPAGIGWLAAGAVVATVLIIADPFSGRPMQDQKDAARQPDARQASKPEDGGLDPVARAAPADAEARLQALGVRLAEYQAEHGRFPPGSVASADVAVPDRFSWLAQLAARSGSGQLQPWWNRPWHDPVNDRFVRRSLPEFQNPAIEQKVGQNRYPATHFVGVAGVGDDAAELPADHPRAGVFGYDRRTRLDDIRDGAAHTMAVAGASADLGSWAAAGRGTVRPLAREPYINGPDGFGTGQEDGMFVLMADGSVRFVSRETSPVVMRRMAAMADGLPLDSSIPGEPGVSPPSSVEVAQSKPEPPAGAAAAPDAPIDVPIAAEPPVAAPKPPPMIDVAGALAQKIRRFEQKRGAPFGDLLLLLEEMAGVPIRYDEDALGAERLSEEVSLKAEETTVGGILEAVLGRVGLAYTIQRDGIRLHAPEPVAQ